MILFDPGFLYRSISFGLVDGIDGIDGIDEIEGIYEIDGIYEVKTRGRGEMGTRGSFQIGFMRLMGIEGIEMFKKSFTAFF